MKKVNLFVYGMKAYRRSGGIDLLINFGIRWMKVANFTPDRFTRGFPRYPLNRRLSGPRSRCGRFRQEQNLPLQPGWPTM
jgi:hypothetical protein